METRYNASVNDVWLSDLDDRIVVTDIREDKAEARVFAAEKPASAGTFFERANRKSLSVTIVFVLWERSVAQRRALLDLVNKWAGNDMVRIQTNNRPGQYLNARMIHPPVIESAMKWLEEIEQTFTAHEVPFWRLADPVNVTTGGEAINETIPGNGEAFADVMLTNNGDTPLTAVRFHVGDTMMFFGDLNLPKGGTLAVFHDKRGLLHAVANEQSVLELRRPESDDELVVRCGEPALFSVEFKNSENPVAEAVFTVQGVYV